MKQIIYHSKQAWASLSKKPGFIATVITTMGVTLGALLCVLTLGYFLLIKPLPYPEHEKLYKVEHVLHDSKDKIQGTSFTYPGLIHLYKHQDVFSKSALIYYGQDVMTNLSNSPRLETGYVTPEWFELLDAHMILGRQFEQSEALNTHNPVVVISHQLWHQTFDADPNILDRKVEFSGISFNIVGVLDKSFIEPQIENIGQNTSVWFPFDYNQGKRFEDSWGNILGALTFVGKKNLDVTDSQAAQTITALVNDKWQQEVAGIAFFAGWRVNMALTNFHDQILGDSGDTVYLLLAGVIGLVLIATANISNLLMSRTAEQQRQLAIFAALGAKQSQLFKTLLAETGVLMGLSVLFALIIAMSGFYIMQTYLVSVLPRVDELAINVVTLTAAVLFALLFALMFAGLSRRIINYKALNSMLQSSGKGTGIQVSKKTRQFLIVSQVAIATVLVFANISLFKEAYNTITETRSYKVEDKLELTVSLSSATRPPREEIVSFNNELKEKLTQLPQVESVSLSSSVLRDYNLWALTSLSDDSRYVIYNKDIDDIYFDMLNMEVIEGDNFSQADIQDRPRKLIVNDVFAKQLNPSGSVIGMQLSSNPEHPNFTIIGVVKGIKLPGHTDVPARVYGPTSRDDNDFTLNLLPGQRLSREQAANTIKEVSSLYALFRLEYFEEIEQEQLFTQYATAITTSALAILTFFLAGVGLYGILSYGTHMRRFELGTRMAIGAKRKHLVGLIIKDNVTVVIMGVVASIVILTAIYLAYDELFMTYLASNIVTMFIATVAAITGLSLFACYWPLRQFINQPAIYSLRNSD